MTVRDLQAALAEMDPEAEVLIPGYEGDWDPAAQVQVETVRRVNPDETCDGLFGIYQETVADDPEAIVAVTIDR